jgi:AcrR family transcriptional regulator
LSAFKSGGENYAASPADRLPALADYWPARGEERRDAAERRRHILATARGLFEERGVESVSMHEVARAAGVGQGTMYRRFEHKGALCSALLYESMQHFSEEVRERIEARESALDGLSELLAGIVRFNEENAALLGAIRASGGERDPAGQYRGSFYRWLRATVAALLERAVGRGEIPPPDLESVPDAILAPLNIDLYLFQRRDLGLPPDRILGSLQALLLDGLRRSGD